MEKVRLFFLKIDQIEENIDLIKGALRADEIAKAERYKKKEDKLLSLGSSYLKRRFVFGDGDIKISPFGKPCSDNVFFNVTHSIDTVCIALSDRYDVGVDIEAERDGFEKLKNYCLSENEKDSGENFFALFTSKESLAKAEGCGLRGGIKNIPGLPLDGVTEYKGSIYYRHHFFKKTFHLSVCLKDADFTVETALLDNFIQ